MIPNVLAEPPSRFKVGFKEGFPSGKVETKFVPQYGVWVVNGEFQGQQQIYALKTVCTHRANIMRKLQIHSVGELVRYAFREKITAP